MHRCLFINTYYDAFINAFYSGAPGLASRPYNVQLDAIQGELFGDSNFYSKGIKNAGWYAEDVIVNCLPLQQAWADENGFSGSLSGIAEEQIRRAKPDVLYIQDMNAIPSEFLAAVKPYVGLVAGQIACPFGNSVPFAYYNILFSCVPHFVRLFRSNGLTAYYQPLAFNPAVSSQGIAFKQRSILCSFVGGISPAHAKAYGLMDLLAKETPVKFWGYGVDGLPAESPIRPKHQGVVWGKDMFAVLKSSLITINRHIDIAENYAANMRLFESTGCGALLITDYKDNLSDFFDIGNEIIAYRSPEECVALVKYYLSNPDEAGDIAFAGQQRTLREHTYEKRMEKTAELLERHIRYKKEKEHFTMPDMSKISYGHTPIQENQVAGEFTTAWKSPEIPKKQRALVQQSLFGMFAGQPPAECQVLADIISPYVFPGGKVLEIGCASGYYYEILEYLLNTRINYTGLDYSESLISMAADYYPKTKFITADGAFLPFADREFPIVISSCILLHVPNYVHHISETARVASDYVVAHRTPVCRLSCTRYMTKFAYGVKTVELIFNESEILSEFEGRGLKLMDSSEYYSNEAGDEFHVTYLFKRI